MRINTELIEKNKYIVVDSNNLIFHIKEHLKDSKHLTTESYMNYMRLIVKLFHDKYPNHIIFHNMKDPNLDFQISELKKKSGCTTIKNSYKKTLEELLLPYKNTYIMIAYGENKSRDDFGVILLSSVLKNNIIISRDRYKDVVQTNFDTKNVEFIIYGDDAEKYKKLIDMPFLHIDKGDVTHKLVGYRIVAGDKIVIFNKKINKNSLAGEYVMNIGEELITK
jgi:hypothetical protein